jgi:hypothetical protein
MPDPETSEPITLDYARTKPLNRYAQLSVLRIVFLSIVVPGLGSSLIRSSPKRFFLLTGTVAIAFGIFGPPWGEILFKNSRWQDAGLYPFLPIFTAIEIASVRMAIEDRKMARDLVRD